MKTTRKPTASQPAFVTKAGRALRRAARNVQRENRRLGLPLISWRDKKVVRLLANG